MNLAMTSFMFRPDGYFSEENYICNISVGQVDLDGAFQEQPPPPPPFIGVVI